jgi:hypothetical protein
MLIVEVLSLNHEHRSSRRKTTRQLPTFQQHPADNTPTVFPPYFESLNPTQAQSLMKVAPLPLAAANISPEHINTTITRRIK